MFTSYVIDPVGAEWSVTLQIIPRRQGIGFYERLMRKRSKRGTKSGSSWTDFLGVPIPDGLDDISLILGIIFLAIVFYFIGWPLLLLLADFIWLILVLLGALISIVVLHRPVTITAESEDHSFSWRVRGFIAARRKKQLVMQDIFAGVWLKPD